MEEYHRKQITDNAKSLANLIDLEKLLPKLKETTIFPYEWMSKFTNKNLSSDERLNQILESLPKRGPLAFGQFVQCLKEAGQIKALQLLVPDTVVRPVTNLNVLQREGGQGDVLDSQIAAISYGGLQFDPHTMYQMERFPRGLALLINNITFDPATGLEERQGAQVDQDKMMNLLQQQLGFIVTPHTDLKAGAMFNAITNFTSDERHRQAEACVVCIMTHGSTDLRYGGAEVLYGTDGVGVRYNDITAQFSHQGMPNLLGKPKVIFLQACRGDATHIGITLPVDPAGERLATDSGKLSVAARATKVATSWSDIFVFQSTLPGTVSLRDIYTGTWFIDSLVKVFKEKAHQLHLYRLCAEVQIDMDRRFTSPNNYKQTGETRQPGVFKDLYFNPGYSR